MSRPGYVNPSGSLFSWALALAIGLSMTVAVHGEEPPIEMRRAPNPDASRLDRLEQMLQSVIQENQRLSNEVRSLKEQLSSQSADPSDSRRDVTTPPPSRIETASMPAPVVEPPRNSPSQDPEVRQQSYLGHVLGGKSLDYEEGLILVPGGSTEHPFSLKINFQDTFRYDGFIRAKSTWINSAGDVLPINNNNSFQIPRGRVIFSGKALLPKLSYLLNIDYNTVTPNPIGFRAYVLSYRFSRAVELHVGQNKVPGSREWLVSSFVAQEGPDRSMATTFFRPSLSQGIWLTGEPIDRFHYHAMMSNGFNTLNLPAKQLDNRYCWSASGWYEPWGDFGAGYGDLENHDHSVIRAGGSYTFALGQGSQSGNEGVENNAIRLSDGTLITALGALAPGVTLQKYDISLAAFDLAYKYRGLAISAEGYLQNLSSLQGNGPIPFSSTQAYGGFVQGGYFVIPQEVELYGRTSYVTGHYGAGSEFAGGLNWFILKGKSNMRFTFDSAWLEHSPADQNRTGYFAGQTGFLLRSQISTSF